MVSYGRGTECRVSSLFVFHGSDEDPMTGNGFRITCSGKPITLRQSFFYCPPPPPPPTPLPSLPQPPVSNPSLATSSSNVNDLCKITPNHGLCATKERGHMFRALIESVCLGTELVFEAMRAAGYTPSSIAVAGGATRSQLWLQVLWIGEGQ